MILKFSTRDAHIDETNTAKQCRHLLSQLFQDNSWDTNYWSPASKVDSLTNFVEWLENNLPGKVTISSDSYIMYVEVEELDYLMFVIKYSSATKLSHASYKCDTTSL